MDTLVAIVELSHSSTERVQSTQSNCISLDDDNNQPAVLHEFEFNNCCPIGDALK